MNTFSDLILTRAQVRDLDRRAIEDYGMPAEVLMENAGRNTSEWLITLNMSGPVVICCGKGNNGGDGFVIARYLDLKKIPVEIVLFADPKQLAGAAKTHLQIAMQTDIPLSWGTSEAFIEATAHNKFINAAWIIDCLLGTGLKGAVQAPYIQLINKINQTQAKVMAVDVPSGLDCDTGLPLGTAIRADYTASFIGLKQGFMQTTAKPWVGTIKVIAIGLPRKLLTSP